MLIMYKVTKSRFLHKIKQKLEFKYIGIYAWILDNYNY